MQLSEIWIYPVKSLGGISLQKADLTDRGLQHDRRWLLVDRKGSFITQRNYPQLALFQTEIKIKELVIFHKPTAKSISIPLDGIFDSSKKIAVTIWDDVVAAFEVDATISIWFSSLLDLQVKLVYMPDESQRKVDPTYAITGCEINSFSDGYPFLGIGQASLNDLNERLEVPVPMNRFRPNFVFSGGLPYEEEMWQKISMGGLPFFGVKPCARCILTTVNQDLGIKENKEPLSTLSGYKKVGNKVIFGQNFIGPIQGTLCVGDEVKIG